MMQLYLHLSNRRRKWNDCQSLLTLSSLRFPLFLILLLVVIQYYTTNMFDRKSCNINGISISIVYPVQGYNDDIIIQASLVQEHEQTQQQEEVQYVYDEFYTDQIQTPEQSRTCIDLRSYCLRAIHLCPDIVTSESHEDTDSDIDMHYMSFDTQQRWMVAHCPVTCDVCDLYQTIYSIPTPHSIAYQQKQQIDVVVQNNNNDNHLFSKLNANFNADTIRDAMTGYGGGTTTTFVTCHNDSSRSINTNITDDDINGDTKLSKLIADSIGIQYLMSTSNDIVLEQPKVKQQQDDEDNDEDYDDDVVDPTIIINTNLEHRHNMIQYIQNTTRQYVINVVIPMLQQQNDSSSLSPSCSNNSPYCTYWAVVYERCNDPFYFHVMLKHCPVTCQLCHHLLSLNDTVVIDDDGERGDISAFVTNEMKAISTTSLEINTCMNYNDDSGSGSSSTCDTKVFDSSPCMYDPEHKKDTP